MQKIYTMSIVTHWLQQDTQSEGVNTLYTDTEDLLRTYCDAVNNWFSKDPDVLDEYRECCLSALSIWIKASPDQQFTMFLKNYTGAVNCSIAVADHDVKTFVRVQ